MNFWYSTAQCTVFPVIAGALLDLPHKKTYNIIVANR